MRNHNSHLFQVWKRESYSPQVQIQGFDLSQMWQEGTPEVSVPEQAKASEC